MTANGSTITAKATVPTGFELILPFLRPIEHLILDPEMKMNS